MKKIVVSEFGAPEVMKCLEAPDPAPGPGQVLVEVKAAGVNPVDTYIRSGVYPALPALPYTPGRDAAGLVSAVGEKVTRFKPGDRVYLAAGTSAYAALLVADETAVRPLPAKASFEQGACLGVPCATAYRALMQVGRARPGERLLVHGASGSVGQAVLQFAKAHGLSTVGTAGTDDGLEVVRQSGAHTACRHQDSAAHGPYDLIIEMLANINLDRDLDMLNRRGRVVIVGNRGKLEIDPRKTMTRDLSILGMSLANAEPAELEEIHAAIEAALECGILAPNVTVRLPLEQAAEAHRMVMEPGQNGKIVLLP